MIDAMLASFTYDPVQRVGPLSPHGIGTALGYLAGAYLMSRAGERRGIARAEVYNMATWGAVGAIIGARGFYVVAHFDDFASPLDWLKVWEGGLTMFGGFALGLAFGVLYMRRYGYDVASTLDAAAPGFVAGVAIGRVGDLVIADHLGKATDFVLGYRIPAGAELAPGYGPPMYVPGAVVHATALYDLAGVLVLGGVLALIASRAPKRGVLFATFAAWYGMERFLIDFTRNTDLIESSFFGLSGSQWAGLLFSAAGLGALIRLRAAAEPVETAAAATTDVAPPAVLAPADLAPPLHVPAAAEAVPRPEAVPPAAEAPPPSEVAPPEAVSSAEVAPPDDVSPSAADVGQLPRDVQPPVSSDSPPPVSVEDRPDIAAAFAAPAPPGGDELSILDQVAAEIVEDALEEQAWRGGAEPEERSADDDQDGGGTSR